MPALALKPSSIVSFPGGQRVRLDSPKAIQLVQSEIFASGLLYNKLAEMAGISASTIGHIASGQTQRPSFNTIASILGALGWSIIAEKD